MKTGSLYKFALVTNHYKVPGGQERRGHVTRTGVDTRLGYGAGMRRDSTG